MARLIYMIIMSLSLLFILPFPSYATVPLPLDGFHIEESQGGEVFLDLLERAESNIKWTAISMKPSLFGIAGKVENPRKLFPGTPSLTLRVRSGERLLSGVYRLEWKALMVFANHDIVRGETLSAEDLEVHVVRYKRSYGDVFSDITALVGKRAKRRIVSGEVISSRDVEKIMMVERGDRITIISRTGRVNAELPGVALESGSRGSTIRVRIKRYRKDIHAMVLGPGMVLVEKET